MALLSPLFVEEGGIFDGEHIKVATLFEVSSSAQLKNLQLLSDKADNIVVDLLDWQVVESFSPSSVLCIILTNDLISWSCVSIECYLLVYLKMACLYIS